MPASRPSTGAFLAAYHGHISLITIVQLLARARRSSHLESSDLFAGGMREHRPATLQRNISDGATHRRRTTAARSWCVMNHRAMPSNHGEILDRLLQAFTCFCSGSAENGDGPVPPRWDGAVQQAGSPPLGRAWTQYAPSRRSTANTVRQRM
ncbi:hypothetical protein FRACA_310038 [Frankia canadensis]|uniref:Uncharacterized protein n=1 Tax=Frankia canadensis TaxID=1836972 RepID=A0A2I2KUA6_9ACTN|nr:hypothetical protein FRACA_310038 [Frankia canadensis]SOU56536.1 hypothetical protein FRACA_310038 [Frankia canadensis]